MGFEVGQTYGGYTIVDGPKREPGIRDLIWLVECDCCGDRAWHNKHNIKSNKSGCSGCRNRNRKVPDDVLDGLQPGVEYGSWTVVEHVGMRDGYRMVACRCVCGTEGVISYSNLTAGKSTQCKRCPRGTLKYESDVVDGRRAIDVAEENGVSYATYRERRGRGDTPVVAARPVRWSTRREPVRLPDGRLLRDVLVVHEATFRSRVAAGWDLVEAATKPARRKRG